MRIYMQMPAADNQAPRFYHIILQQDLLGDWTLLRESGHQGAAGRIRRESFETREAAEHAMIKTRDAQLRRGYRVVFNQGE